jgi:hypothetical protein
MDLTRLVAGGWSVKRIQRSSTYLQGLIDALCARTFVFEIANVKLNAL